MSFTVSVSKLANCNWDYVNEVEYKCIKFLQKKIPEFRGKIITPPSGWHPQKDLTIDTISGRKINIEVKITKSIGKLFIETWKVQKNIPSGLEVSEADVWLVFHPMWTGKGDLVVQSRLIPIKMLKALKDDPRVIYEERYKENTARGFTIDTNLFKATQSIYDHQWLGYLRPSYVEWSFNKKYIKELEFQF